MSKSRFVLLALAAIAVSACSLAQETSLDRVHPLVGTAKEGQTYPSVGLPFAMTTWTPQTRAGEIKCIAPYYFADPAIQGFRGSHFMSGSCVPDYGSFTLMPLLGALKTLPADRASTFDRATEHAHPYSYSVTLKDSGIHAEITGTTRAGIQRFRYTQAGPASLIIENNARGGDGWVKVDPATHEVTGEVPVRRAYAGSGKLAGFSSYFIIQFSRPFTTGSTWIGPQTDPGKLEQTGDGQTPGVTSFARLAPGNKAPKHTDSPRPGFGAFVQFGDVPAGTTLLVRIGTSFVSIDEARKNLAAEIPTWNYDAVEASTKAAWQSALDSIVVKDNIPDATVFYTSLYHALLHPRIYSDVDGSYPGFAAEGKTEHATGFTYYDDFSMWDIFRAQLPLLTIIDPHRDVDFVRSLMAKAEQGGYLPIYPAWNSYTSEMIGDHSGATIIDAYAKHLPGFDPEEAYRLIRKNAMTIPADHAEYIDGKGRRGLPSYLQYGYIPLEDHMSDAFHSNEQVSRTLEYAYDDAMIAEFATALGKTDDATLFRKRGQNWRNVIDPVTGYARGRNADGTWATPFDPNHTVSWITEGLPSQYTFFVPQDIPGLIAVEGGQAAFTAKLDALFADKAYDHGNEPSHHIAYLYDTTDSPWKTQEHVRSLLESQYKDSPDGLAGNDDAGQMSAWYILTALGFYQVSPGIPDYWLGSPRFDESIVHLPNGHTLKIEAPGAGHGKVFVHRLLLNGKPLIGYKISYSAIMAGGTLHFDMADTH